MTTILDGIRDLWCGWTHGGGIIMRDPSGRINWQCWKCGRWSVPISAEEEQATIDADIAERTSTQEQQA